MTEFKISGRLRGDVAILDEYGLSGLTLRLTEAADVLDRQEELLAEAQRCLREVVGRSDENGIWFATFPGTDIYVDIKDTLAKLENRDAPR